MHITNLNKWLSEPINKTFLGNNTYLEEKIITNCKLQHLYLNIITKIFYDRKKMTFLIGIKIGSYGIS